MRMDSLLSGKEGRLMQLACPEEGELIEIVTPYFDFYLKGELKSRHYMKVTDEDLALYEVRCDKEAEIQILNVGGQYTSHFCQQGIPQIFEQSTYQVVIEAKTDAKIRFDHDSPLLRHKVAPVGKSKRLQMGVLNFGNEIGLTELRILVDDKVYLKLNLEVYPTKLSYKADYLKLREDVAEEIYNLTFDFMRKTYLGAALKDSKKPSLTEFWSIFREQFETLKKALDLIIQNPHHELRQVQEIKNYRNGTYIGPQGLKYLRRHPHQIERLGENFASRKFLHIQKQLTQDVYENQLVKYMVQQIIHRLKSLKSNYMNLRREADQAICETLESNIHALEQKLNNSFFKEVSKLERMQQFSIVMQMSPIYRQFYKIYLILQKGLSISADLYKLSNKDIAELYEYWCFIKLGSLLKKKHQLLSTDMVKHYRDGLYVALIKGKASTMRFRHSITGEIFTLAYNQKLAKSPTVVQQPDNMLTIQKEMTQVNYQYAIDAKYKLNYLQAEDGVIEVPQENDINTMHRYRDAIVHEMGPNHYERTVFGGIILFPGTASEEYRYTDFYQSIQKVNIGGLPFLPSNTKLVEEFLDTIINRIGHEEYEKSPYINGIREYMQDLDIATRDVLIGPIKGLEELNTVLRERIYHVPCRKIKDYLNHNFKQIILYEHQALGTLSHGGLRYVGEIQGMTIKKRKELEHLFPMHRNNPEEDYLVYTIKNWTTRKTPILPKGYGARGPSYTNSTLLAYAKTLLELHIKDAVEFKLILQLRRLMKDVEAHLIEDNQVVLTYGNAKILVDEAKNIIVQAGEQEHIFTAEDLEHRPKEIYKVII